MNFVDENYLEVIKNINSELGISIKQIMYKGYEVFNEEMNLILYGLNQNGIEVYLESETLKSFNEMKTLALSNSVNLQVQSGFRSVQKQSYDKNNTLGLSFEPWHWKYNR